MMLTLSGHMARPVPGFFDSDGFRGRWVWAWLPRTKPKPGQRLSREQKRNNRVFNHLRSVVEQVIARIKTWRVLHAGFRRSLGVCGRVFLAAGGNFG